MNMKEIILQVLDELKDSQINLASESARQDIANKIHERVDAYVVQTLTKAI